MKIRACKCLNLAVALADLDIAEALVLQDFHLLEGKDLFGNGFSRDFLAGGFSRDTAKSSRQTPNAGQEVSFEKMLSRYKLQIFGIIQATNSLFDQTQ